MDADFSHALERGKHPWGRMVGIEQAKIGTTQQLTFADDKPKTLSHVEVKISGVSSEVSKEIMDHLAHLISGIAPILSKYYKRHTPSSLAETAAQTTNESSAGIIDHYADVNVRDVTCFIRSSKCPELTQIRLDTFQLDREIKIIKGKLTGLAMNVTQFIGTKIKCASRNGLILTLKPYKHRDQKRSWSN